MNLTSLPRAQLNSADHALRNGYPELAVLHSQTACEVATAQFMARILDPSGTQMSFRPRQVFDLTSERDDGTPGKVRRVFERLTCERLAEMPWWTRLQAHAQRRHDIVHTGLTVDMDAARDSYDVSVKLVGYLAKLLADRGLPEFSAVRGPAI